MKEYNTIKNPLTIIAIFAGITEISGTIVLPLISENNQEIYMWFLMIFPTILVVIFFSTLNWNHKVLYAPSDFKDDKNFLSILEKSTTLERIENIKNEINLIENEEIRVSSISDSNENSELYKKEDYEKDSLILRDLNKKRIINIKNTENYIFQKLEEEYSSNLQRNLKFTINRTTLLLDAVVENESSFICFEFLYMPNINTFNRHKFEILISKYELLFEYFNNMNSKNFILKIICATYLEKNETETIIRNNIKNFEFKYEILVFDIDKMHYT